MNNYIVLLFHSVDDRDLFSLKNLANIHPEVFEKILRSLKRDFDIVSVDELVGSLAGKEKGGGPLLAITFDDGPKSYAAHAAPIMESLGIPSTCFLITDCVGDKAIYWRYLYNFCFHGGYENELAEVVGAVYGTPVPKEKIISFTRSHFTKEKNERVIKGIFQRLVPEERYRERERGLFLSMEDIELLKRNPLVGFGIHTRTHPVMLQLSGDEIFDEVSGSLDFYRARIKDDTPMFSIPFGRLYKDYDERTVAVARDLSIEVILSAYGGCNHSGQSPYNIRRISVHEGMWEGGMGAFRDLIEKSCAAEEYSEEEKRLFNAMQGNTKVRMP